MSIYRVEVDLLENYINDFAFDLDELGTLIKAYRKRMNLTQKQLSERTKVNIRVIQNIEQNKKNYTIQSLFKIAEEMNLKIGIGYMAVAKKLERLRKLEEMEEEGYFDE